MAVGSCLTTRRHTTEGSYIVELVHSRQSSTFQGVVFLSLLDSKDGCLLKTFGFERWLS
jgi:hypothetical protein